MINEQISSIIRSRQSTCPNEFNGKIISEKIIIKLLENANCAPTHKMTQPWIFKVFCGNSKTKLLNEIVAKNELAESKKRIKK